MRFDVVHRSALSRFEAQARGEGLRDDPQGSFARAWPNQHD